MCPSLTTTISDAAGRRRSPITQPGYRAGQPPANAGKKYPAEVYRPVDIFALLAAWPVHEGGPHRASRMRNRALTVLLWRSGLRIAEALSIEPKDIDLELGTVAVLSGKGGNRRTVPFDRGAEPFLIDWLELRAGRLAERCDSAIAGPGHGPVFCVVNGPTIGRPLKDSCAREAIHRARRKAGLRRRMHPHGMRHTFASEVYFLEGAKPADLQLALGHSHASTTDRYIHRIAPAGRLLELLRDREWPDAAPGGHAASPPKAA